MHTVRVAEFSVDLETDLESTSQSGDDDDDDGTAQRRSLFVVNHPSDLRLVEETLSHTHTCTREKEREESFPQARREQVLVK